MLERFREELNLTSKPSITHLYIFNKLNGKKPINTNEIGRDIVEATLCAHGIAKIYHHEFLEEMRLCGLLKRKDKQNFELGEEPERKAESIREKIKVLVEGGMSQKAVAAELKINKRFVSYYFLKN